MDETNEDATLLIKIIDQSQKQVMQIQKLKISEPDRQTISSFMGESYPDEIDFNLLMEVIKKINGGRKHTAVLWEDIVSALVECDIEKTFAAVVKYLEWFYKKD